MEVVEEEALTSSRYSPASSQPLSDLNVISSLLLMFVLKKLYLGTRLRLVLLAQCSRGDFVSRNWDGMLVDVLGDRVSVE